MARPRGYITWNPNEETRGVLEQMLDVLDEQRAYLPISLRQMFYLGVSKFGWPKTEKFYKNRLGEYLNKARRAGIIPFDVIRDDGITESQAVVWDGKIDFHHHVRGWVKNFKLNPMLNQPRDVVIWTEGKGLVPNVRKAVDPYQIEVISSGGFDGLTVKKQIADRFRNREGLIIHIGDYDPSGETMHRALEEDIQALGGDIELLRAAVTPEQIDLYNLPTKPPKRAGNSHAASFHDDRTVELEAFRPSDLQTVLRDELEAVLDMDAMQETWDANIQIRAELMERFGYE